jgi:cytochrome c biogenesis protein ResB
VWNLLTNVKFALALVGLAGLAALLGVVIPQMPGPMRENAAARSAWLELRRDDFGSFTGPMDRLDLFEVFQSPWFNGLWVVIILAVTVCSVSRFLPTWRSVHRPATDVGDRYFETAHHRADYSHAGGAGAVATALRKRRYRVAETRREGDTAYLFAERYSWSSYGTFLSHLALLMLLVGGLLTRFAGFDETFALAEGTPGSPVFDDPGPGQIFVRMVDAHEGRDAAGNVVDFHSDLEVTRGDETVRCTSTVNDPCEAFGYRLHQAAYFDDIARLRITGPDGRLLYDDVLDFDTNKTAVPAFRVTDAAGTVLFDGDLPQQATDAGASPAREDDVALGQLAFAAEPGSEAAVAYAVAWRVEASALRLTITGADLAPRELAPGESAITGHYRIQYTGPKSIPVRQVDDMPGATGPVTVQMPDGPGGEPYLFVTGLADRGVAITPVSPFISADGHTYAFDGQVQASGINVRRDPGDTFIWVAVGMAIVGLAITFYVPRRRLWVKVTPSRTYFAGIAEKTTRFSRELRLMGAELGSRDALRPEDQLSE